ncbi:MAG: hypothetical protein NXY59_05755 [Aigarchaeota archaeon]|nr:hypothetical protein [Candidatus Pelearchaeum maunauluense]
MQGDKPGVKIFMLIILLTIIWALFLGVSVILSVLITLPEGQVAGDMFMSAARVFVGLFAFAVWVFVWERLTEFWLYRIMLRVE